MILLTYFLWCNIC